VFGLHGAQFERLAEAGMDIEQVYILRQILTNPNLELAHAGIINLTGEVKGDKIQAGRWAKCIRNWVSTKTLPSLGGTHGYILARECADGAGNRPGGTTYKIFLPVAPSQDPNVEEDDIIMFFQMPDGSYMAPGYGDNRIGTVMMGVQGDKKVKGWGVMNGTNNAKAIGGSGIDAGDKFLRQWTSQAQNKTTGGSATGALDLAVTVATHGAGTSGTGGAHTHTATSAGAHGHSMDTQGAHTHTTENVTIAPHAAHNHSIPTDNIATGDGSTVLVGNSALTGESILAHTAHDHEIDSSGGHTHTAASGGAHTHPTDDPGTHTHTTPTLSHSVTVAAGGGGSATAATIPPFLYVAMLERLNNSGP